MARTIEKSKARSNKSSRFIKLEHRIMEHPNFIKLTPYGEKLLIDLLYQFRGTNNGDLCAAYSVLKERGWRSSGTLQRAIQELLHYEFIRVTRQGGRNKPTLYALTWLPIDYCGGKLEVLSNKKPGNEWQQVKRLFKPIKKGRKINSCTPNVTQCTRQMH